MLPRPLAYGHVGSLGRWLTGHLRTLVFPRPLAYGHAGSLGLWLTGQVRTHTPVVVQGNASPLLGPVPRAPPLWVAMAGLDWAALGIAGSAWGFVMDLDQDPVLHREVPQQAQRPVPTPSLASTEASDTVREAVAPQRLAKRRDAPVVAHTTGAKRHKSTSLLPTDQRAQLLGKLREKKVARSSAGSYCSHMRTWLRLHRRWFGVDVPLITITPLKIEAVASQMSHLRYRSFANYLASAKRAHVLSPLTDGSWGENLKLTGRDCTRAVTRGIGPAKQCAVFEGGLAAVLALKLGAEPLVPEGLIGPINLVVLG